LAEGSEDFGFGLYLHWPFCQSKCPYCDFNSHVSGAVDHGKWAEAFEAEIARAAARFPERILNSVFFGGGTPSLMPVALVDRIMGAVRRAWPLANDIEITLEANPGSVETQRFAGYRLAGVDRVSLGVQALDDRDLRRLGRLHSVEDAMNALEVCRSVFDRVSIDLIYARQDQSVEAWRSELSRALDFGLDHLSLYQLTIENGTAFGDRFAAGGLRGLPDETRSIDLWDVTQRMAETAGLPAYEVSNHARPGQESRHNMLYWEGGDYVGIGPGAHGRERLQEVRYATESVRMPSAWLLAALERPDDVAESTRLTPNDEMTEFLLMGLRVRDGVCLERLEKLDPTGSVDATDLISAGLLEKGSGRLRCTSSGRPLLNAILGTLLS